MNRETERHDMLVDAPGIDLISASSFAHGHPFEQYEWLRKNDPVYFHPEVDGPGFWALTKHADVRWASRLPKQFSSYKMGIDVGDYDPVVLDAMRNMMLFMDPPEHHRFKSLVSKGFTPSEAVSMADRFVTLCREIIDDVIERGECEFVSEVAGRLPSGVIAEMLGIPRTDGERLYELTEIQHTTDDSVASPAARNDARIEMINYAKSVADDKRAHPGNDITTILVNSEIDGDRLSDEEIQWFFLLLINAGGDTTRNLLAGGLQLLLDNPDQRIRLTQELDTLLNPAVEEMLRAVSPVARFRRTATEDVQLRDKLIRAGDKVVLFYGSANYDEDVFENPNEFDVGRDPNPHVAFGGGGPHLCLGLHVARMEIRTMLSEMLTRLSDIELNGEHTRLESSFIAGSRAMPIRFTPGCRST
jgi:cytochrome P450